jgi:nitroimidazol reductase NimA-like FMN-containing flavoprotein (pyridoxamine 5'-phosphate oxidase superfamily)
LKLEDLPRTFSKIFFMLGALNSSEMESLIHREFVGRIGCHANDMTYIVPVSYAYDGEYVYVHTEEGLKLDIMRKNPRVCFQVDDMHDMANWQSVIAWGNFEEVKKEQERAHGIGLLMNRVLPFIHSEIMHISPHWPFPSNEPENIKGIIFRIRLTKKTGRYEKSTAEYMFAT